MFGGDDSTARYNGQYEQRFRWSVFIEPFSGFRPPFVPTTMIYLGDNIFKFDVLNHFILQVLVALEVVSSERPF